MTKKQLCIIGLVIFAVGLLIIWLAPTVGTLRAESYILTQGGYMDTTDFVYIKESVCLSCQIIGGLIAFFAGLGTVLSFLFYNETTEVEGDYTEVLVDSKEEQ